MKTYSKKQHGITVDDIDANALYILEKLRLAGYEAYLVGGSVRDLTMGVQPKDFDISTSAKPEEIKAVFRNCILIGRRFRLAHIRFGKKIIEVATFRAGDNESDELIVRDNEWGTAEEDVLRRDFTINGLYYDSETETIIDYVNGYEDAQNRVLRAIGPPFARFKQDPVRMIRLLKFQARFGLSVEKETDFALLECRQEIVKSSSARILEELLRMLESGHATAFFVLMTDRGLLQLLLPEIATFLEKPEGNEITAYLQEVDLILKENRETRVSRSVLLACLIYPLYEKKLGKLEEHPPHLGAIFEQVEELVHGVFSPFLTLPRRLRTNISSLITSQYRITPLAKKKKHRIKVPQVPEFTYAIDFFKLRSRLEPGLQETLEVWQEAIEKNPPPARRPRSARPRRRRR